LRVITKRGSIYKGEYVILFTMDQCAPDTARPPRLWRRTRTTWRWRYATNRGGKSSPDTPNQQPQPKVQITHAAHPLRGLVCPVISEAGRWQDATQILIELPDGERCFIPINWTDRIVQPDYPPGVQFPLERLVILMQRLEVMQESCKEDIMAAKTANESRGGSHASVRSGGMGTVDPPGTDADPPHPSANAPSPIGGGEGGAG
jgi:hypothetical protein